MSKLTILLMLFSVFFATACVTTHPSSYSAEENPSYSGSVKQEDQPEPSTEQEKPLSAGSSSQNAQDDTNIKAERVINRMKAEISQGNFDTVHKLIIYLLEKGEYEKAVYILKLAANYGDLSSAYVLASMLCEENITEKGISKTAKHKSKECLFQLEKLSNNENTDISGYFSFYLSMLYDEGYGVPENEAKWEYWTYKSALLGYVPAYWGVSIVFLNKNWPLNALVWAELTYLNRDRFSQDGQKAFIDYRNRLREEIPLTAKQQAEVNRRIEAFQPLTPEEANRELKRFGVTKERGVPERRSRPPEGMRTGKTI